MQGEDSKSCVNISEMRRFKVNMYIFTEQYLLPSLILFCSHQQDYSFFFKPPRYRWLKYPTLSNCSELGRSAKLVATATKNTWTKATQTLFQVLLMLDSFVFNNTCFVMKSSGERQNCISQHATVIVSPFP